VIFLPNKALSQHNFFSVHLSHTWNKDIETKPITINPMSAKWRVENWELRIEKEKNRVQISSVWFFFWFSQSVIIMAGDAENKRGYRTIFRSISQVFYANAKNSSNTNNSYSNNNNNNTSSYNNNSDWNTISDNTANEGIGRLTVTLTSITPPTATWTSTSPTISICTTASSSTVSSSSPLANRAARSAENISCSECGNPDPYHSQDSSPPTPQLQANDQHQDQKPLPVTSSDQNRKLRASSMLDLTSNHRHQNALRVSFDLLNYPP